VPSELSNPPSAQLAPPRSPSGEDVDPFDPELLALPDPPKGERRMTLLVLLVTAIASVAMVFALRRDAAYAFASDSASDLGDLVHAPADAFEVNRFVRGHAALGAAGAIRYERAFEADSYRVWPLAGRPDVYVETRIPSGEENARYVPKTAFAGRLISFDTAGPRHRGLAHAIENATGAPVPPHAWLLIDGQKPTDSRWTVALVALFAAFAAWNLATIARFLRKPS
jgi:hypothetical protein